MLYVNYLYEHILGELNLPVRPIECKLFFEKSFNKVYRSFIVCLFHFLTLPNLTLLNLK